MAKKMRTVELILRVKTDVAKGDLKGLDKIELADFIAERMPERSLTKEEEENPDEEHDLKANVEVTKITVEEPV